MKKKLLVIIAILFVSIHLIAQNKTALLIANGKYENFSSLVNPVPEAQALQTVLQNLGFQVTLLSNASKEDMVIGLRDFKRSVQARGGIALFHYGGHAVQVDDKNYLLPSDADIPDEDYVGLRALDADEIMVSLDQAGSQTNIVILDSCRNNPLPAGSGRSASRGLTRSNFEPPNTVIVYSAKSGQLALDGVFTPTFTEALKTPGLSVQEILMKTRQEVYNKTGGQQIPGEYTQLFENVYLFSETSNETARIPEGFVLIKAGTFIMGSPENELGRDKREVQHQVTLSRDYYMGETEVTQGMWEEVMGTNVQQQRDKYHPDWSTVGEGENNPMYYVSWEDAVDFCNRLSLREGLTPCYSGFGNDIKCDFNANGYRLPTEAEWEFAARGGILAISYQRHAGSNNIAEVAWYSDNSGLMTMPVGLKAPNQLGLYDMSGNVLEWCWDWYDGNYSGNSVDPLGALSGGYKISRGGSWDESSRGCRVAKRYFNDPRRGSSDFQGFRIVRTVN